MEFQNVRRPIEVYELDPKTEYSDFMSYLCAIFGVTLRLKGSDTTETNLLVK
jgi:hypothetical protein